MKLYPICVPTYNRPMGLTMKIFKDSGLEVYYYCQTVDYAHNYAQYDQGQMKGAVFVVGTPAGVANARNYIVEDQLKRGNTKIFMLDDDISSFKGVRRKEKPTAKTLNETYKMSIREFMEAWQSAIPENCVACGPARGGFTGTLEFIGTDECISHLDGRMWFDIKALADNGISFKTDTFENKDVCLQILKHRLPVPLRFNFLASNTPGQNKALSTLWNMQGHTKEDWCKNLQADWGSDIIKLCKEKDGTWGTKTAPIKKLKKYFGIGFNLHIGGNHA